MDEVLRGVMSLFERDQRRLGNGILRLVVSDYVACYRQRREPPRRLMLLFIPRLIANPQLHATALLRLAFGGPRAVLSLWRTLLLAKHSIEIMPGIEIGPGLRLPHPHTISFGPDVVIGSDVTIYHNVSIGGLAKPVDVRLGVTPRRASPRIEDEVIIYTGSVILGPITVGRGAVVGAQSWLVHDLEAGATHVGGR